MCLAIPARVEQLISSRHDQYAVPDDDVRDISRPPLWHPGLAGDRANESLHQPRPYDSAIVSLGGVRREISLALVDDIAVGDYVIVHVGFALQKLDQEEAAHTLALFAETGSAEPR